MSDNKAITIATPAIPSMTEVESLKEICKVAAYSGFLKSTAPRSDMTWRTADAFFVVMYGRELGIPPMTALKTIFVVDGKPSCSGEALLGMMRNAGVEVQIPDPVDVEAMGKAVVRVRRSGGDWRTYTFTRAMAETAGLWGKNTWAKYPPQMLIWRAVSMAAKYECSDITGGLRTIEELAPNTQVDEDGAPIGEIVITATPFPVTESNGNQTTNGHEPDSVRVEQSSAKVVGVQPNRPTPPPVSVAESPAPSAASGDDPLADFGTEQGDPMPHATDPREADDLNLYHCDRLKVNKTKTATQYILFVQKSATRINVTSPIVFEGLTINGAPIIELPADEYPLDPSWSVRADSDGKSWDVHSIEAEMAF